MLALHSKCLDGWQRGRAVHEQFTKAMKLCVESHNGAYVSVRLYWQYDGSPCL